MKPETIELKEKYPELWNTAKDMCNRCTNGVVTDKMVEEEFHWMLKTRNLL